MSGEIHGYGGGEGLGEWEKIHGWEKKLEGDKY